MERSPQTSARDSKGKQGQDRTCPLPKLCAYGLGTKGGEDNDGLPSPTQGRAVQGPVAAVGQDCGGGEVCSGGGGEGEARLWTWEAGQAEGWGQGPPGA